MNTRYEQPNDIGAEVNELSNAVIRAALDVHRALGPGLLESVYEEALCIELKLRGISFTRQTSVPVRYKRYAAGEMRLDLLVGGVLIVELKAVEELAQI